MVNRLVSVGDDFKLPPAVLDTVDTHVATQITTPGTETATALSATYAPAFPDAQSIVIDSVTGNVTSVTTNGITTAYTYNADGTVATDSRTVNGVTTVRNYGYTNGNLTSITKAA